MTLIELIEDAERQLMAAGVSFGHGTNNAFDEAAWLALWCMQLPLDSLQKHENRPIAGELINKFATLLRARIDSRKPAAYLTQEAWLQGVPFYVDERVIVPRSFIAELLADGSLDEWLSDQTVNVLDLCTGNGSLAVLAAMAYPDVRVQGADLSKAALEVAKINVAKHGLQARIELMESDGLQACHGIAGQPYDLILCNPPYVNTHSMASLPPEYLAEPDLALAGGADGMDFIRPLLAQAAGKMSDNAVLVLEIGNERDYFEQAFPSLPAVWLATSAGQDQVLLLTKQGLDLLEH
jgi:ribosomal protein L3 glutamine methyltransferase